MHDILIKTVEEGTGKSALTKGIEVGGKTGTANIVTKGQYTKTFTSSFFGFANDKNNKYTIGVTVHNVKATSQNKYQYYASNSAVPVFKSIIDLLIKQKYLTPNIK
jgi:cell division protein FtsI (penicillin-binding protein 3)